MITELTAADTARLLRDGKILLVDVREPAEFAAERIDGAISMPLSQFDPAQVPTQPGMQTVFHCGIGKRSRMAIERCVAQGFGTTTHMAGGLAAWKAAGLPIIR